MLSGHKICLNSLLLFLVILWMILCIVNVEDSFAIAHTECRKYCIFVPGGDVTEYTCTCSKHDLAVYCVFTVRTCVRSYKDFSYCTCLNVNWQHF